MKIVINNWEKYNPRKDVKHTTWVRLNNNIYLSQDLFGLDFEQKWAWISLLCIASDKQSGELDIDPHWFSHHTGISEAALVKALEALSRNGCVRWSVGTRTRTSRARIATNERTNERNVTNTAHVRAPLDFASLYQQYPRKIGKQAGIEKCKKTIKTREDFAALALAVRRYAAHCQREGTEPKFIKHFSSFMNSWRDWCEPDAGTTTPAAPAVVRRDLGAEHG